VENGNMHVEAAKTCNDQRTEMVKHEPLTCA